MPYLAIETGIEEEYEQALITAAKNAGWKVQLVQSIPFTDDWLDLPKSFANRSDVWFHGSIGAAKTAQKTTNWQVHADWNFFKVTYYSQFLGARMLNGNFNRWLLEQLDDPLYDIFKDGEDGAIFIRPDGADKLFNGGVVFKDSFEEQLKLIRFYDPPGNTLCCVSRPRNVSQEARFLIVDGKLITGSLYRVGRNSIRLKAEEQLMDEAERVLKFCLDNNFNPDLTWVLDLGYSEGYWHIMEVGPSACCGLYACDMDKFIDALNRLDIFKN